MLDTNGFKEWLNDNTDYSDAVVGDTVSRLKRADRILDWYNDEIYQFRLERENEYRTLSVSVRSQIKKAVKLYFEYVNRESTSIDVENFRRKHE